MTMNVYEFTRCEGASPVLIFARELDEAERIYRTWVQTHHPDEQTEPERIYLLDEKSVASVRPLLATAANLGLSGVAYWRANDLRWVVAAPEDQPLGDLLPTPPRVHYYRVEDDEGVETKVFAVSFEEATNLYCVYHNECWGELPERFTIHKRSRWELTGEFRSLREDLHANITGVARLDEEGRWSIVPPDSEPSYTKRS